MSAPSSLTEEQALEQLLTNLGGPAQPVERHPLAAAVMDFVHDLRGLLMQAAHEEKIGPAELARRLDISTSAVSRQLRNDGDIRASTAAALAFAMGRKFVVDIRPDDQSPHHRPNYYRVSNSLLMANAKSEASLPHALNQPSHSIGSSTPGLVNADARS